MLVFAMFFVAALVSELVMVDGHDVENIKDDEYDWVGDMMDHKEEIIVDHVEIDLVQESIASLSMGDNVSEELFLDFSKINVAEQPKKLSLVVNENYFNFSD